ncbi:hypothetical protein ISF74_07755 [Burkholderia pseudomallei]|nr:hypothetical protein [Burkholderia pseudomallei]
MALLARRSAGRLQTVRQQDYRAWRAEQMAAIADTSASARPSYWPDDEKEGGRNEHPGRQARERIVAFRAHVRGKLGWQPDMDQMPLMRRALGIPSYVPMTRPWWMVILWLFITPLIPLRWRLLAGRTLLGRVRTYEGREYLFERFVAPFWITRASYSEAIDHALRHLPLARAIKAYDALAFLERGDIDAVIRLGLTRVEDMPERWRDVRRCYALTVIHALIDEGVLQRIDELGWLPVHHHHYGSPPLKVDVARLRSMVRVLLSAAMPREKVPDILDRPYGYDAMQLSATLTLLRARDLVDVAGLFDAVGERLWRVDEASWCLVVDTIGAGTPGDIKRFRSLLDLSRPAPIEVVTWMREHGASLDDLADAKEFLVQASRMDVPPVSRLERLAQCDLPVMDIVHCADYILHGEQDRLARYLDILARYGYGDRASILAFHACYASVGPATLDRLLNLVGALNDRMAASFVAMWVKRAQMRQYLPSLEYVVKRMPAKTLDALNQRLFAMDMCPMLVRYVVEEQGLNDPRALYDWYYAEAWGAKDYAGRTAIDAAERVLMGDAFRRKNFAVLEGNRKCLDDAVSAHVRTMVSIPDDRSEAGWKAYHETQRRIESRERDALASMLPGMLAETRGVLLRSLLETTWSSGQSVPVLLATLRPLMADLARGRGPMPASLTDIEAEAIAVTYGVTTSLIGEYWTQVIGWETSWDAWYQDEPYVMHWQRSVYRISRPLDHDGLRCLAVAAQFARRFGEHDLDVFYACKHLRASQLANPLADHHALRRHLGVLLAAASEDERVKEWLSPRLDALSNVDDESASAHREIGELHEFFCEIVPEALVAGLGRFVARFNDDEARHLALRLDARSSQQTDGRSMLRDALERTREKVLDIYQRWSAREKRKFKTRRDGAHQSAMHAFVSKHPAAFFAKQATGLCSWNNVKMWQEARHAHLVVFDPLTGKLAALALLYVEVVPDLDATRPALILRGINPTVAMVTNHEPHSVVEAFFALAMDLARAHGLAGVAFPSDGGQDFMSNRTDIGTVIRKRYEKRSVPLYRHQEREHSEADWRREPRLIEHAFSAYEQGHGSVGRLYAIWRAPEPARVSPQLSQVVTA